ncbi:MAG TPA: SAM-dependent methyltransferase [Caulobacteraceae bacterium]|jgi:SAM-dependent MidA family methyltransferase
MSLEERLKARIRLDGPMTVADYVTACLHDPQDGYYAVRPRIGSEGDFITAPLISQMFGELLGLWAVETWRRLGAPERFRLVEVGPGDGTLIDDALRAARLDPAFLQAAELVLVEPSRPLRAVQARRLAGADLEPRWLTDIGALEADLPVVLIANEVLDCLPARQFVRTEDGWAERRVGLDAAGALTFGLGPAEPVAAPFPVRAREVVEIAPAQQAFGRTLGELVGAARGAALLIDYGRGRPEPGDTLQALRGHRKIPPLQAPGHADLTMWADFPAVLRAALGGGADVTEVIGQGAFLKALGIEARAAALARANPQRQGLLSRQVARLTAPDQMGELFKAAAIFAPRSLAVPGFEARR